MVNWKTLRWDIPAGLVVFLVALPLCLGIAQACGLPPIVGLVTGVIGGVVVTTFSPSKFAVSGPAAGLITIVTDAVDTLGTFSALLFALFIAGVIQFFLGVIRAGRFITLVPDTVIKGLLAAIGILLIIQQLPVMFGLDELSNMSSIFNGAALKLSAPSLFVTGTGLLILWFWSTPGLRNMKALSWIPGPLAAVLLGCLISVVGSRFFPGITSNLSHISLPALNNIQSLTDELQSPDWTAWKNPSVYIIAMTLAIIASLETLLSQEALKKIRPQTPAPSPNKEMCAQRIGNALSGLIGGLPITAVIVRSSVNVNAGAQSKFSVLLHGVLLLVCGLYLSGLLNTIPLASLAAVLLYTGYKLASVRIFVEQFRQGAQQSIPFLATVAGILAFGIMIGIGIGLAVQIIFSIYKSHQHAMLLTQYNDHFVLHFHQNLTFMHNPRLIDLLAKIPENSVVIVEHDSAGYLDPDVQMVLRDFARKAPQLGIKLHQWPVETN